MYIQGVAVECNEQFREVCQKRPGRNAQTFRVAPGTRDAIKFAWTWATDAKL